MTAATGPQASGYNGVVDLSRYPINDPAIAAPQPARVGWQRPGGTRPCRLAG